MKLQRSQTTSSNDELKPRWGEFKIDGSNIGSRAYSAVAVLDHTLYVHGGYQVQQGILSTFYSMELNKHSYKWNLINCKPNPGALTRHSMFVHDDSIYLLGGQKSTTQQSNTTHKFDTKTSTWIQLPLNKSYPAPFDNHASCKFNNDTVAIFGGYSQGKLCNTLYFYRIASNEWSKLEQSSHAPSSLVKVVASPVVTKNFTYLGEPQVSQESMISGSLIWSTQHGRGFTPELMGLLNGFVFESWKDKLVLFGGIHDITWELNDLWTFDMVQWKMWEADSTHREDSPQLNSNHINQDSLNQTHLTQKSNLKSNNISPTKNKRKSASPKKSIAHSTNHSPEKHRHHTLEDQRKKEFELRKMDMLKHFEVTEHQADQLRSLSPTSETMRNALNLLGNPLPNTTKLPRLTDFGKETVSKFLEPLRNVSNTFFGKRPCARDGHKSTIYQNYLIIFGGDRHQMSFNDLHALDLTSIE